MSRKYPQVYLDITIGTKPAGRVTFELFTDLTPKTAENFRGLCTGEYGNVGMGARTKRLHFLNTAFHRIIEGFAVQGGDITSGDGTGGASIYGPNFADENFSRKHACAGLLSMANRGRNTNSSQFFITLKACPHLDGKHVVFGQVIDGMEAVRKMAKVPVDMNDKPKIPVMIIDCGEVGYGKDFLRYDPFQKSIAEDMEKVKKGMKEAQEKIIEAQRRGEDPSKPKTTQEEQTEENGEKKEEQAEEEVEEDRTANIYAKLDEKKKAKLDAIKMRINEARKLNNQAVVEEERKMNDPNYEKIERAKKWNERKKEMQEENEFKGIDEGKEYLNTMALKMDGMNPKKKVKGETFGWDVFNEDTLFGAYKKRLKDMPHYKEVYEAQMNGQDVEPSEEKKQKLVDDLQAQQDKRDKFSRRRKFEEDEDINYINDRNRVYNKKLERAFGKYAADIKLNLERGTALNE